MGYETRINENIKPAIKTKLFASKEERSKPNKNIGA